MVMQQEDQFRSVDSTKPLKTVKQLKCIYGMIQNQIGLSWRSSETVYVQPNLPTWTKKGNLS